MDRYFWRWRNGDGGAVWRRLLLVCALGAPGVWGQGAQTPPKDLTSTSLEDLMNVEVTSVSKKEQKLSEVAAAIYVITPEDIRRSGARNIPDLLRMVPGLDVAQIDASRWAISARGFNLQFSNKLLVLIDGRAVYTPLFGGVNWDTKDVPLEDIERIEVIRGPGGTIWGANAVKGVINVITRQAADTQGVLLTGGGGTVTQSFGTVQYGGRIKQDTSYRVFGSYQSTDHYLDAAGLDANDGWHLAHGGFREDSKLGAKDTLTTQGDIYTGEAGATIVHSEFTPPDNVSLIRLESLSGGNILGRWNHVFSERSDTTLQEAKDDLERRVEARTAELQHEVRERIQAEEKLQKSLKELEDLKFALDQHCIVARTDARGVITSVNEKFCTVSKYAPEELIGQTHKIVNSRHHSKEFFDELWRTISSGQTWRWVDTTIVPFRGADGRPFQYIAIRMDITNLKRIEEELRGSKDVAEQASRAKSEFLANMSHEIRTPLNGIMGMTDLALDTQLTQEQRDYLETVKSSSDSLLTVINDILDFSKIEAGKLDLECAEFELRDAVESTLKTLAMRAGEKKLELLCEIAADVPEMVRGDAVRIRQVLTNLTGNAIKFTEHGEVALRVEKDAGAHAGQELSLRFTVADTGVGILASKLKLIFDPFSQADTSTTRKYGGTGLGLTISARLVEMMDGKIWVESELGRGSQFHFTVKLEVSGSKESQAIWNTAVEQLRGLRVLVVDDNPTNRRILDGMLRNWFM
jgi:PAS domain S-box-containing protein